MEEKELFIEYSIDQLKKVADDEISLTEGLKNIQDYAEDNYIG